MHSRFCCALKKAFLYWLALYELKKQPFSAKQKFSICRKLDALPSKASRFRNQKTAHSNNFLLSSKTAFHVQKTFFCTNISFLPSKAILSTLRSPFQPPLTYCPQKNSIFTNQKPFFCTNLSLLPSKAILFHPPFSIRTTLNLLFAKNTAVLLLFA